MSRVSNWLWGATLGAVLMYFYDPNQGDRRRSMIRDQFAGLRNNAADSLDDAVADLQNRYEGLLSDVNGMMRGETPSDRVLEQRVRANLGRLTYHPGSVDVHVSNGHATLNGDALASEVDHIVSGVSKVRGIRGVDNQLNVHETADSVSSLQGMDQAMSQRGRAWAPGTRLLAGAGGGLLVLTGPFRRSLFGRLATLGGWGLIMRSLTNLPLQQMVGLSPSRQVIDVQRSFRIPAPVNKVYDFFSNFENFPRFMSHIESVKKLGDDRSHWVAKGPAGIDVEWDAIETQNQPNEVIAWKSTPDSQVKTTGTVRFRKAGNDETQVNIHLYYNPPAGALGHAVATLFGVDPSSALTDDMQRVKSLLTEGKTTVEGEEVTYRQPKSQTRNQSKNEPKNQPQGNG